MRVDLHVHTRYSGHSLLKPEQVARTARRKRLDALAITDHDTIRGVFEVAEHIRTIMGEEISCDEGDVIGLFISEEICKGPALEVMDKIRSQGGVVVVPHPFDRMRSEAVMNENICLKADVIEVFNSRVLWTEDNLKARAFSERHNIPACVGSDAHTNTEIGRCWMELDSIDDASSFMRSLRNAKSSTSRSPAAVHAQTKLLKIVEGMR